MPRTFGIVNLLSDMIKHLCAGLEVEEWLQATHRDEQVSNGPIGSAGFSKVKLDILDQAKFFLVQGPKGLDCRIRKRRSFCSVT